MLRELNNLKVTTVTTNCDFCGSDKFVKVFDAMRHGLNLPTVICANCSLSFTSPRPDNETLGTFYEKYYHKFHGRKDGVDEEYNQRSVQAAKVRSALITKLHSGSSSATSLLEIGTGAGQFIKRLSETTDWNIMGIEVGKESFEHCRKQNLNVENVSIEEFNTDKQFDIVTSFHVLEHVVSPKSFISKCYSLLKENGLLYLEVPNFYKPARKYTDFLQFPHLYNFSYVTLMNYMEQAGFEVVFIKDSQSELTVIGKKTGEPRAAKKEFIKPDITQLSNRLAWVNKVQGLAGKMPALPVLKRIKFILSQVSV